MGSEVVGYTNGDMVRSEAVGDTDGDMFVDVRTPIHTPGPAIPGLDQFRLEHGADAVKIVLPTGFD